MTPAFSWRGGGVVQYSHTGAGPGGCGAGGVPPLSQPFCLGPRGGRQGGRRGVRVLPSHEGRGTPPSLLCWCHLSRGRQADCLHLKPQTHALQEIPEASHTHGAKHTHRHTQGPGKGSLVFCMQISRKIEDEKKPHLV